MNEAALGQSAIDTVVGGLTDTILKEMMPKIKAAAAEASKEAYPMVSRVVREDVIPSAAPWLVIGILGLGATAALIGAAMARRGCPSRVSVRRRRAA